MNSTRRQARKDDPLHALRVALAAARSCLADARAGKGPWAGKTNEAWRSFMAAQDAFDAAATALRKPGRDGNELELVEEQASDANVETKTSRNIANDPVEWLFNRGSLTQSQYEAATRIRADAEASQAGAARAVPIMERVEGGASGDAFSVKRMEAMRRYTLCLGKLGDVGAYLIREVVVACRPLKDVAEGMGMDKNYRVPRLAEALDAVARFYRI